MTRLDAFINKLLTLFVVGVRSKPVAVAEHGHLHAGVSEVSVGHLLASLLVYYLEFYVLGSLDHIIGYLDLDYKDISMLSNRSAHPMVHIL